MRFVSLGSTEEASMNFVITPRALLVAALAVPAGSAFAGINDPNNDFLPSYTGSRNGDLDVVSAFVNYNPGTARFGPLAPGVLFYSVVVLRLDGTATVNRFDGSDNLPAGTATFAGNTIQGSISGALLASTGFDKTAYTWNLWARDGSQAGNAAISDSDPDNSDAGVTAVPEPSTVAFLALGLGALGRVARRRSAA